MSSSSPRAAVPAASEPSAASSAAHIPTFLGHPGKILPPLLVILTCVKILLVPSYRSTDFDVHRNWLSITKQLPVSEWYWYNHDGQTVHTLDYPPGFALFEWMLSSRYNPMTYLLPENDRCFQLLPDNDNSPSQACIIFQRMTVILSDVILWVGAYVCCAAYHGGSAAAGKDAAVHPTTAIPYTVISFLLIVFNPALLWLDHVHFQYNGMLLGVLLASVGCLVKGNTLLSNSGWYHVYHLVGAILFATLLNLKHLYLPLAPLYFCYLLERYCLTSTSRSSDGSVLVVVKKRILFWNLLVLSMVTVLTLMLPWMPFLLDENLPVNKSRMDVLQQIFRRLFPFQRGLLHDYWAANIWALYAFADKLAAVGISKLAVPLVQGNMALNSMPVLHGVLEWLQQRMQSNDGHQFALLPEPSPLVCGALLFLSIIPGMQVVSSRFMINNGKLIQGVVYTSFSAFMLSYHVHEKAILTALLPLAVLVRPTNKSHRSSLTQHLYWNLLFIYVNVWGLLGLFPLLFRPVELLLKITTYILYLALANILLQLPDEVTNSWMTYILVGSVFLLLECMPVVGKWEFLPLMSTSVVCALGLVGCWGVSLWLLVRREEADKQ